MDLFRFLPGYRDHVLGEGKEPLLLLLLAFVIAFSCARGYARMARKRGWGSGSIGGVHLHHEVVGIVLMLVAGLAAVMPTGTDPVVRNVCVLTEPFGLADPVAGHRSRFVVLIYASNVTFTAITFLKAKPFAGIAAVALPVFGWFGAVRPTRTTARAVGGRAAPRARGPAAAL